MSNNKFYLNCTQCGYHVPDFREWFEYNQKCTKCGSTLVDVTYNTDYNKLTSLIKTNEKI